MKSTDGSAATKYGYPKGALALIVAGVSPFSAISNSKSYHPGQLERAFTSYRSGWKTPPKTFSCDNYGLTIDDYMENIRKLSNRRWESILDHAGVSGTKQKEDVATSLSENRRTLYIPSSPTKPTNDE